MGEHHAAALPPLHLPCYTPDHLPNRLSPTPHSSPFSAERLSQLPPSLRTLQLPFFASGGLEPAASLGPTFGLTELRCRQTLTEADLSALAHMRSLATLQCDDIVLSEARVAAGQAALTTTAAAVGGGAGAPSSLLPPLPSLPAMQTLRLTGHHHRHSGLLGLLFPGLKRLHVVSLETPHPRQAQSVATAMMPGLQRLSLPSCKALPSILAAAPALCRWVRDLVEGEESVVHILPLTSEPGSSVIYGVHTNNCARTTRWCPLPDRPFSNCLGQPTGLPCTAHCYLLCPCAASLSAGSTACSAWRSCCTCPRSRAAGMRMCSSIRVRTLPAGGQRG